MKSRKCSICGDTIWPCEIHKCDPIWRCIPLNDYSAEKWCIDAWWTKVRAKTAAIAAQIFQEDEDTCEGSTCDYGAVDVIVKDATGKLHHFEVQVELIPTYLATKKDMEVKVEP